MAAPYPRRGPMQGQARAGNRGAKGMAGGKFAGLNPVRQPLHVSEPAPPGVQFVFDGSFGQVNTTTSGGVYPTITQNVTTNLWPTGQTTATSNAGNYGALSGGSDQGFTFTRAGLYELSWYVSITSGHATGRRYLVQIDGAYIGTHHFFLQPEDTGATASLHLTQYVASNGSEAMVFRLRPLDANCTAQGVLVFFPVLLPS